MSTDSAGRLAVRKTYKLYIGGAFPRSESGRSYPVTGSDGQLLAHAAQASRKDLREAVVAARSATGSWARATAYNRGQILYRIAEMMESRRADFAVVVQQAESCSADAADRQVSAAIDRWVWYAGWTDKYAQVRGSVNPVAGPYFNFSLPQPCGVVAVVSPAEPCLLGFVSAVAPALATGNTVVALAAAARPLPAITLAEALATSDLPGGVLNVLTGFADELGSWIAGHRDIDALDLSGIAAPDRAALAAGAADNVKRVYLPDSTDYYAEPGMSRLDAFVETKTVWHPLGL